MDNKLSNVIGLPAYLHAIIAVKKNTQLKCDRRDFLAKNYPAIFLF